jgi:DNA-binding transcriptional LysR family regulator
VFSQSLLPPLCQPFLQRYPDVSLNVIPQVDAEAATRRLHRRLRAHGGQCRPAHAEFRLSRGQGELSVACLPVFSQSLLPPLCQPFLQRYPDVSPSPYQER